MKATIYTKAAAQAGEVSLPETLFNIPWNADLVHEVVTSMMSNARAGTADTKGRGEVRGGGKKPWRQKGTGRARHGSRRSPIWRGGGVAHGPISEKDYSKKINRAARNKALAVVLSKKFSEGEIIFVDSLGLTQPAAKEAKMSLTALSAVPNASSLKNKRKNAAVIVAPGRDVALEKSFQNFGNICVVEARNLNPVELLTYKHVIVVAPEETVSMLEKRVVARKK